ncbi:PD40 domain-containing protein [Streptomyces sp. SID8352]|uniref:PD40 domain-containing protein n=1 Tax=Streptomyces sp. SID8352 TaxID=2690338 RepID=UPI00136FACF6|nr:PD40 domain-containing protein [Streptomyces sp. SID8352]MYU21273.1 hypothetical protein [Streptomyces sp. SID8352]
MTVMQPITRAGRASGSRRLTAAGAAAVLATAAVLALAAAPAQAAPAPRGTTSQVDAGLGGAKPNGGSTSLDVSADGHYALFTSDADNLVAQPSADEQVYVRDLRHGRTERISALTDGTPMRSNDGVISANGRYVAFTSLDRTPVDGHKPIGDNNIYVRDRRTGRTELISAGNGTVDRSKYTADSPSISANGRYVAFASTRTDLLPVNKTPSLKPHPQPYDIFVTDRWTHTTRMVSTAADGSPYNGRSTNPTISADGRTIGFSSTATELLPVPEGPTDPEDPTDPTGPEDGQALTVARLAGYYVRDLTTGTTRVAATDPAGVPARAALDAVISPDGRTALYSLSTPSAPPRKTNHLELYARNLRTGTVKLVSTPLPGTGTTGDSHAGAITADNRWVYFTSHADNLVPGPHYPWLSPDIYRHDLRTGRTERMATTPDGSISNGASSTPFVDARGTTVVFQSSSGNLLPGSDDPESDRYHVFARNVRH